MTIKNIKGAFGEEYSIGNDDLKYCTNPILVRQYFSGEAESVGVQAYSDCIVGSYQIEDYVNMNGFKTYINDEEEQFLIICVLIGLQLDDAFQEH